MDNDGNALVTGALYYRTTAPIGMKVWDGAQWIEASAAQQASLVTFEYVATAGQITFSGADANGVTLSYTVGNALVSVNGVRLRPGDDFTATNGTSVVLVAAAAAGDEVLIDAFRTFEVANTYTQAQVDALLAGKVAKAGDTMTGALTVNNASNGVHLQTQVAGVNAAALGSYNGAPTVGSNKAGYSGLMFNGLALEPTADGLNVRQSQVVDIGSTGYRFKTGHFTGVNFPASQVASSDANTLDDYEEGTWTPVLVNAGTVTYNTEYTGGRYTKIGNRCIVTFEVRWGARSGGSGDVAISGLPFTRLETTMPDADRGVVEMLGGSFSGAGLILHLGRSSASLLVMQVISGGNLPLPNSQLGTSGTNFLRGNITYCTST